MRLSIEHAHRTFKTHLSISIALATPSVMWQESGDAKSMA